MKYKRVFALRSLLCFMLCSMIIIGGVALSRIYMVYNYLTQYAAAAAPPPTVTSGTNLSLLIYGDPEPARPTLNLFQYVTAQNIEWRGSMTDPQGNPLALTSKLQA